MENTAAVESLAAEVGRRLRERRLERNETLHTVAGAASISLSHLAEIETGKSSCSLPVLIRLSRALDFPVAHILPTLGQSRLRSDTIASEAVPQRTISHDGLDLIVRSINLGAGQSIEFGLDGCESMLYTVSGSCSVDVAATTITLNAGDSAEIRRCQYISLVAIDTTSAILIIGSK